MAAFKYAYAHPPFNFLGRFTATQWDAFQAWVKARQSSFPDIAQFYQIRAQQLRKTGGVLEQYYSTENDQTLAPTFSKELWAPGPDGHFSFQNNDDHVPAVMMSRIKVRFKEQLQRDEEAVFEMNRVRCLIEKNEDTAQFSYDFTQPANSKSNDNPQTLQPLLDKINSLFSKPEYVSVLVDDKNTANFYKGQPYYRVHQADTPTQWELEQMNHSDASTAIAIKEQGAVES
jgi:hypothetical protein